MIISKENVTFLFLNWSYTSDFLIFTEKLFGFIYYFTLRQGEGKKGPLSCGGKSIGITCAGGWLPAGAAGRRGPACGEPGPVGTWEQVGREEGVGGREGGLFPLGGSGT